MGGNDIRTEDFDYPLPQELIAQEPLERRDCSRLLVLRRDSEPGEGLQHRRFHDLPDYLSEGDCLVLNDTRVMAARLLGQKVPGGARAEVLLLGPGATEGQWRALLRRRRRFPPGTVIAIEGAGFSARVEAFTGDGQAILSMEASDEDVRQIMKDRGQVPLPPYIDEALEDPERYQTVYSESEGSVAAPTAGLHFTPELLSRIEEKGISLARITLHVGHGTFRPIREDRVSHHRMHSESYSITPKAAGEINDARFRGGRVVASGTTVVRTLESACGEDGKVIPGQGETDLFIYPGFHFRVVDLLITNFHLPRSSLLVLVSALAGRERIMAAYREAIRRKYRFYSLGDAMLIL